MNKLVLVVLLAVGQHLVKGSEVPADTESSVQVQDQAQDDYARHQQEIQSQEYKRGFDANENEEEYQKTNTDDGAVSFQFDRQGPSGDTRDRGYGYEKAYAYSRETTFVDFNSDKPVVNAKDLVESDGNIDYSKYEKSDKDFDVDDKKTHYYW